MNVPTIEQNHEAVVSRIKNEAKRFPFQRNSWRSLKVKARAASVKDKTGFNVVEIEIEMKINCSGLKQGFDGPLPEHCPQTY